MDGAFRRTALSSPATDLGGSPMERAFDMGRHHPCGSGSPTISVIVPALNEAPNLPYVFSRLPPDLHEVVLVDGGSVDGTVDIAQDLYPKLVAVEQTRSGKGNAL